MSIRSRIAQYIVKSAGSTASGIMALLGRGRKGSYKILDTPEGYIKAFEQNEWVFSATTYRATQIGQAAFMVMEPDENAVGGMVEVPDHPILPLINDTTEVAEVTGNRNSQLEQDTVIFGSSYLFIETMNTNEPVELVRIEPQRVEPIRSIVQGELVGTFRVTLPTGQQVTRDRDEMIYFRPIIDPKDATKGVSRIRPIRSVVEQSLGADALNAAFFANSGRADVLISLPGPADAEQRKEVRDGWVEEHNGPDASAKPTVISNGAAVTLLSTTPKEADFNTSQSTFMLRISTALGVDPVLLGFQASNKASFEGKKLEWWEAVGVPQLRYYARVYTKQLLPRFQNSEGMIVVPNLSNISALVDRELARVETLVKATGGVAVMTPNAAGKFINQPKQKNGDELYAPLNVAPIGEPIVGPTEDS